MSRNAVPSVVPARIDIGALVQALQRVDGDPVIAVVTRRVGQKTDVVGRRLAFVAPFLEEGVKPLAHQRTRAVTRILRNQEDGGKALHPQKVGVAFRREAFLFELRPGVQRGFQLARDGVGGSFSMEGIKSLSPSWPARGG